MITYTNEIKLKDLPEENLKLEVEELIKIVLKDFGIVPSGELFSHTVNRLTYLLKLKYKGLMLGEVKYVFECMVDNLKGKVTVAAMMQLFSKYFDEKIEKQRREVEEREQTFDKNYIDCSKSPLGRAMIYRMEHKDCDLTLKQVAEKIQSGEIKFTYKSDKRLKHIWDE